MIIRDPRVNPVPTTPESPSAYSSSGISHDVRFYRADTNSDTNDITIGLDVTAQAIPDTAERTVDIYSIATLGPITGSTDVATLYHYSGSWTSTKAPAERSSCKASKNHVNRASQTRSCELPIKLHIKMSRAVQFRPMALTVRPGWLATQPTDLSSTTRLSSFGFR